jgi:hypothetical protein
LTVRWTVCAIILALACMSGCARGPAAGPGAPTPPSPDGGGKSAPALPSPKTGEKSAAAPAKPAAAPSITSVWPIYSVLKDGERTEVEVLSPLYFHKRTPQGTEWGIRPFVTFHREIEPAATRDDDPLSALMGMAKPDEKAKPGETMQGGRKDTVGQADRGTPTEGAEKPADRGTAGAERPPRVRTTWEILYPLSYFRTEPNAGRSFFAPIYYRSWRIAANGQPETANVIFPLAMWGHSATEGSWFLVPLLGGVSKGLLGQDSITSVSLLYHRASWSGTVTHREKAAEGGGKPAPYVQHFIVWPLLTISSDGQGHRAFRLWPFYGHTEQKGVWWNGYVMWPFWTNGSREAQPGKMAGTYWQVWPFWGESHSRDHKSGSISGILSWVWNDETHYRSWRTPWPIVVGSSSPKEKTYNIWPFYGHRKWATGADHYYVWPFVHTSHVRARNTSVDDLKVFPFYTATTTARKDPPERRTYHLLWPFWRSRSHQKGDVWAEDANSLQLAWFADSESFDRSINGLLGFYEHEASSDGRSSTRYLMRMVRFERTAGSQFAAIGPFVSWSRAPGLTKTSFLLGLVETGVREGRRGWRLFFVPFGASLSEPSRASSEGSGRGS